MNKKTSNSYNDSIQYEWEKKHLNVSGLNPKDFKYFKYDDPYIKDKIVKCSICGKAAYQERRMP